MTTKKLFVALIVLCGMMQLITLTNAAACVCNEPGVDQCARCKDHIILRPQPKPNLPPISLPPIGDNCWCNKLRVEPATLPKTCYKHNLTPKHNYNAKPQYGYQKSLPKAPLTYEAPLKYDAPLTYDAPLAYEAPLTYKTPIYNNPPTNYYVPPPPPPPPLPTNYDSLPADPVSISLAIQAGKAIAVPEAKLAYGFVKTPLDGLPKIQFSNVPEENLFKLKKEIITLKKTPYTTSYKSEYESPVDDEYAKNYDNNVDYKLTYKQLGYKKENFINPTFQKIIPKYTYAAQPSYTVKPLHVKARVDCGFKPGRVAAAPHSNCCKE